MLYFAPVENFGTSNPFIEMKWNHFELDIPTDWQDLTCFNIKTFSTLTSRKKEVVETVKAVSTGPEVAFDIVNHFLTTLTTDEQQKIAYAFLLAHAIIKQGKNDASDIEQVEDKIADVLNSLDLEIDLCRKTEQFVHVAKIPLADMSDAGSRPQDSEEMTFHSEEAILIIAITIFMKLIAPIMGAFIYKYSGVIDNEYKESHTRVLVNKLHERKYRQLLTKLHFYIKKLVEQKLSIDATSMFNGHTLAVTASHAVDVAIVKRLVCVDLSRSEGNIIKYLASCGRGSTESAQKNINTNRAARTLTDPVEQDKDEGNISRMEVESTQSAKTADIPIILTVYADILLKRIIDEEELDQEEVETVKAYYRRNPVIINIISQYLLCMFYGPDLAGGASIMHMNATIIGDMCAVLQMIFAKHGAYVLAHALTFNVAESPRQANINNNDYAFTNGWTSTSEYSTLRKILPQGFGSREWNGRLKQIAEFVIQKTVLYNTAPLIWDIIGDTPRNNKPFVDFMNLMTSIMKFMELTWEQGKVE